MGCGGSKPYTEEDNGAKARSDAIDAELKKARSEMRRDVKLLFLGAGESGKTTVIKQMRLLSQGTYTDTEREDFREFIFINAVQSAQVLADAFELLGIDVPTDLQPEIELLLSLGDHPTLTNTQGDMDSRVGMAISKMWKFPGAKEAVDLSHEFQLNDSAPYFFTNIDRIAKLGGFKQQRFVPTDQDILRARVKTTGISEVTFAMKGLNYKCLDVGGQRSERKKWIQCFEDVKVVLFVVSISEFNQMLYEDESVNRMDEAKMLWESISNSKWFHDTPMILFLNKIDLFTAKLNLFEFAETVPGYTGPNTFEATTSYLINVFRSLYQGPQHRLYHHLTCATDSQQIRVVLAAVNEQILTMNLASAGMM
ncbi:guanine nucleotide-binding protein subunit alpha [Microbotryomycetes sp. JL221]|nr:guanine nucleotide-binding protein subunit alpha [Microbotryomycetes sp. JL221]